METETYSAPQLAKLWGVSAVKVRQWIEAGELPAANLGSGTLPRWRIHVADAEKFWQSKMNTAKRRRSRSKAGLPKKNYV